jgi:hypothetical protein
VGAPAHGEGRRHRQAERELVDDRLPRDDRCAEVALQHAREPEAELREQVAVESERAHERGAILLRGKRPEQHSFRLPRHEPH